MAEVILSFFVPGKPVQQGSKRSLGPGRPFVEDNKEALMPWRESIVWHATRAWPVGHEPGRWLFPDNPVCVSLDFSYARPKSHYRTGRLADQLRDDAPMHKTSAPDIDKLARAALDALTTAGAWRDDAQVAYLAVQKFYDDPPGLMVEVSAAVPVVVTVATPTLPEPQPVEAEPVLL